MADRTGIEWTDATWNPIRGCSRVSEGCRHCYAETQAARIIAMDRGRGIAQGDGSYDGLLAKGGQWNGQIKVVESVMDQPLRWQKPRLIFVNSMSDLFHENVPVEVIDRIFEVMEAAQRHTFQILTKRPKRMREYVLARLAAKKEYADKFDDCPTEAMRNSPAARLAREAAECLPSNIWVGVSVEDQAAAAERIALLLEIPAAVRWLSMEPLVGPVNLEKIKLRSGEVFSAVYGWHEPFTFKRIRGVDWVVVGGESGQAARPMHPEWAAELRDQCARGGVPFLFKQWGEWVPRSSCYHMFEDGRSCGDIDPRCERWPGVIRLTYKGHDGRSLDADTRGGSEAYMQRVGKKFAGRLLAGLLHDGYPEVRP